MGFDSRFCGNALVACTSQGWSIWSCTEIYRQGYFGCKGGSELLLTTDCITVRVPTELALLQKILCWLIGTPCIIYIHLEVYDAVVNLAVLTVAPPPIV